MISDLRGERQIIPKFSNSARKLTANLLFEPNADVMKRTDSLSSLQKLCKANKNCANVTYRYISVHVRLGEVVDDGQTIKVLKI